MREITPANLRLLPKTSSLDALQTVCKILQENERSMYLDLKILVLFYSGGKRAVVV